MDVFLNLMIDRFRVRVSATNDVGSGPWATATCSTFSMPPPPPTLECVNVGAQSLKLRWHDTKNPVGDEKYYYYVEKENENGSYSPVRIFSEIDSAARWR